jgi:hypothetical protein
LALRNEAAFQNHLALLLRRALAFTQALRPDKVWAVLDAPISVALATPLARALGVPLITLVWDDARHIASAFGLDRLAARRFLAQFGEAVRHSERCAVISQPMADHYTKLYGARCVILRHGLAGVASIPAARTSLNSGVFRIGYAGTISAPCAFAALVRALDTVRWKVGGRPIELVVTGPRLDIRSHGPVRVSYRGWVETVDETVALLAEVDVAYLPQPFTPDKADLARYSFPSKLTTYLAAGTPILLHSPDHGSLSAYHCETPLGAWCNSLDPTAILNALSPLVTDRAIYEQAQRNGRAAFERDFTSSTFQNRFAQFIGAGPDELDHKRAA